MLNRFISMAAYKGEDDKMRTAAACGFLIGFGLFASVPMLGVAGPIISATCIVTMVALVGIRLGASVTFEYKHGDEPVVTDRVPSLVHLSARALTQDHARAHMEKLAGLKRGKATDEQIAAAVVENHPEGLDKHLQLVVQKAWLKGEFLKHYSAKERQGLEPTNTHGRRPLLEHEL